MTLRIIDPWQYCVCCIRSGETQCTLFNDALPGPYVPVRVTHHALVTHCYTCALPHCTTSKCRTFMLLSVSLWNDLANPIFNGVGLAGFKSMANAFLLAYAALSLLLSSTIVFLLSIVWYCGAWVFGLIGCISLSLSLALPTFFNNDNSELLLQLIH